MAESFVSKLPICNTLDAASIVNICVFGNYLTEDKSCIFITKDDDVFSMGNNKDGRLGLGDKCNRDHPEKIIQLSKKHVKSITWGAWGHVLAVTECGKLFSWGCNDDGQLGNGNFNNVLIPIQVTHLEDKKIIQVACGFLHSMALSHDGEIFAWGCNEFGQLGLGSTTEESSPHSVILTKAVSIACGWLHSVAVLDNGEVYCWGYNYYGQLGLGDTLERLKPCKVEALSGTVIKQVTCGSFYTLALSDDGAVYSWGQNNYGQLGTGDRTNRPIPHKINSEERFIEIAAYIRHNTSAAALTQTGKVFMWGYCDGNVITSPLLTEVSTTDDVFVLFSLGKETWRMYPGAHQKKVQKTDLAQNLSMVPYSLTVEEMLKLGRLTSKKSTIITIHNFSMNMRAWSKLASDVEFVEEREPVGSGGFRNAYKASSSHPLFKDKEWVIKKYKTSAIDGILKTGQAVHEHTKKVVQMHMLARNFALKLQEKVLQENVSEQFGNTLSYNKIYYGKTEEGQDVTIEEYVAGSFSKYINNTGLLCMDPGNEISLKAECLCHYSYQKSDKQLLLVDIQGSNFKCYDPEIASTKRRQGSELLYCTGNLSTYAIGNFIRIHKCNVYCSLLGLTELQV